MIAVADLVAEVEKRILTEIVQKASRTNKKVRLLSERKIAEMLTVPQSRVHKAIGRLVKQGYLYTKQGNGTYISETDDTPDIDTDDWIDLDQDVFHFPDQAGMKAVKLHVHGVPGNKYWYKLLNSFSEKYPFVEVLASSVSEDDVDDIKDVPCDVVLHKTYELNLHQDMFIPVNYDIMQECGFSEDELCPGILDSCTINGNLMGVPLLRTTAVTYANEDIMNKYGIRKKDITDSYDIFKLGDKIESESNGDIFGMRYVNFIYHSMTEGISFQRKGISFCL